MLRDIREDVVDFQPNYDGKTNEPVVLPSRVPQLLMNGSSGIAVGMATNIPPHNLGEIAEAIYWCLDNPDADEASTLEAVMERIKGPDFPTAGLIVGDQGIKDAYTTGRGSIRMRGKTSIEEEGKRTIIVITELPYQVNPDNLVSSIAQQVSDGRIGGIAKIDDEFSARVGMRIVVTLEAGRHRRGRSEQPLQALGVANELRRQHALHRRRRAPHPPIDQLVRIYVRHQLEVIMRRTRFRLEEEERAHILRGLKAIDAGRDHRPDPPVRADEARVGLMDLLEIDEAQANAILEMQLRRWPPSNCKDLDEFAEIEIDHRGFQGCAGPARTSACHSQATSSPRSSQVRR